MSAAQDRRIRSLEAMVLRQAGEIGQMREAVHRLTHEKAVACSERDEARAESAALRTELSSIRAELDLSRRQHADTKRELSGLVSALARSDERLRALLRREFASSS